eukprot:759809-Hanusia_phi.AAC.2
MGGIKGPVVSMGPTWEKRPQEGGWMGSVLPDDSNMMGGKNFDMNGWGSWWGSSSAAKLGVGYAESLILPYEGRLGKSRSHRSSPGWVTEQMKEGVGWLWVRTEMISYNV